MDDILDQNLVWRDRNGVEHPIAEMDGRYALNVYEYLKRTHRAVAFRYFASLGSMRMPDEHTAAYDIVSDAVAREMELIREKPFHWLLDKPLMRALAARVMQDRVERGTYERVAVEAPSTLPDLYRAPEFHVRPPVEIDRDACGQRPGDESKVFLVLVGEYDDRVVDAVFVGNRPAAYRYAAERDRYRKFNDVEVDEWDDHADGGSKVYGQIRRYLDPWTRVEFRTHVDLETGKVVHEAAVDTETMNGVEPSIESRTEPVGRRGRFQASVVSTGPDDRIDELRRTHADAVNQIRASVMEDVNHEGGR